MGATCAPGAEWKYLEFFRDQRGIDMMFACCIYLGKEFTNSISRRISMCGMRIGRMIRLLGAGCLLA